MKYIRADFLEKLDDNTCIYVNRNILNRTIAEYEINIEDSKYYDELEILLSLWKKTHELEKKNKRIEVFVKMTNGDIKRCFKQYKALPLGSFGIAE